MSHFHERIHFFKQDEHCPNSHVILLEGQFFIKIRNKAKNGVYYQKKIDFGPFCALLGPFCRSPRCTSEMAGWQTLQVKSKRFFASVWWWWKHTVKSIRGSADWSSSCQRPSLFSQKRKLYLGSVQRESWSPRCTIIKMTYLLVRYQVDKHCR